MTAREQNGMMMANIPMPHRHPLFTSALSTMNAEHQGMIMNGKLTKPIASPHHLEDVISAA